MILAGGQGTRLGALTKKLAKPAVPFGGKYRIIDFPLSNCYNSGIDTVGVLTQYQPLALHSYIGIGSAWDLDRRSGGVYVLPPYIREKGGEWYKGTADAIFQNFNFIEMFNPQYVLVLSGDHIYKMDYSSMLDYHKSRQADVTIAVIEVPWAEADRFGIMNTAEEDRVAEFEEKPKRPKNNLASMGIYVFSWPAPRAYLRLILSIIVPVMISAKMLFRECLPPVNAYLPTALAATGKMLAQWKATGKPIWTS